MTSPITNADQAIELCAKVANHVAQLPSLSNREIDTCLEIEARIRSLKDRVASPSDGGVTIDLDHLAMEQLSEAAGQSNWIPKEYFANDWISDCCEFLRTGRVSPDPAAGVTAREETLGDSLFALSARLKDSGFLAEEGNHRAYEAVVRAFSQLSK